MSYINAEKHLKKYNYESKIITFTVSTETVELAAKALKCEPSHIAKTMAFDLKEKQILVVMAGDTKTDNAKFKNTFNAHATMVKAEELEEKIGHEMGGVCPFGIKEGVEVYLDKSLKRFDIVYPACGTSASAVKLTIPELETCSNYKNWVDIGK